VRSKTPNKKKKKLCIFNAVYLTSFKTPVFYRYNNVDLSKRNERDKKLMEQYAKQTLSLVRKNN